MIYKNSIYQHYKLLLLFNMLSDYKSYKYIVRLRLDIKFNNNILDLINILNNNNNLQLIIHYDLFAIGRPNIMNCYCNGLNNNYGKYNFDSKLNKNPKWLPDYNKNKTKKDWIHRWTYAPEIQLFEQLFEYCINNNFNINDTILSDNICEIIRFK